MPQLRLARAGLLAAAIGLNLAPALLCANANAQASASAQASAPANAPKPDTVRPDLFKLIEPTSFGELIKEKKFDELRERLKQADAFPDRTPYEVYVVDRMRVSLGSAASDNKMTITGLEAVIATKRLEPKDQNSFIEALANTYYNMKDYKSAVTWLKRLQKEGGDSSKVRQSLVRAYYLLDDLAAVKDALEPVLATAEKEGRVPEKEDLRLYTSAVGKMKDIPNYLRAMEKLVAHYPTDDYWADLLSRVQSKKGFNDKLMLDLYRLSAVAVNSLAPEEYVEMAELALQASFPTEAKKVMEAGYAKGVLGSGTGAAKQKAVRDKAVKDSADDQKHIASGETAAAKSKDGTGYVNVGYAYVTMDQFDKGIELIEKGIAKGGLKRVDEAKLRLGMAQVKAGRDADAIKTFESVQGEDGLRDLARYWILYVNRPGKTGAAAPAPAAAGK